MPLRKRELRCHRLDGGRVALLQLSIGAPDAPSVVCFPFAGGGPLAFRGLSEVLPERWNVWAIDPPGHVRTAGTPLDSVHAMVDDYMRLLPDGLLSNSILVGQSLGGYVALETAARLEREGRPARGLVIASSAPFEARNPEWAELRGQGLMEWMEKIGQPVHRELFELFEEPIHCDLQAFHRYQPPADRLSTRVLVMGGVDDPICPAHRFFDWQAVSTDTTIALVPGGHFFLQSHPRSLADWLRNLVEGS